LVITLVISYLSYQTANVITALSVLVTSLQSWECQEYQQEYKTGDGKHQYNFDDGKTTYLVSFLHIHFLLFHPFLVVYASRIDFYAYGNKCS
jgi:hypothetical protein